VTGPADQPPGRSGPAPRVDQQAAVEQVATRVQMVIDAAERAAEAIRLDAENQAADYLTEARRRADALTARRVSQIADLTDELVHHADAVRRHSERMVASLEQAIRSVEEEDDPPAGEAVSSGPDHDEVTGGAAQTASSPVGGDPERASDTGAPPASIPAETLLYATRLAIARSDREAVAEALRSELGIADPEPVLARVFDR
jgi:hypothetical protein